MNIKFQYMYRDAGNNKLRGSLIFKNKYNLTLCQIADFITASFIKNKWFDPILCGIEPLQFENYNYELDHLWHEVEQISQSNEETNFDSDIADFLFNAIKVHVKWTRFDCLESDDSFYF